MKRDLSIYLEEWVTDPGRKPILLKGARQVGKSYLARDFGKRFDNFVEINFDFTPGLKSVFEKDLDPIRIVRDLSVIVGQPIKPGKALLFLDEIQECPEAVKSLRYFYEKMPQLHVIAAGSLLDFVLDEIGLPVGRVMPLYLYPLSFMEFLSAVGKEHLRQEIYDHNPAEEFPGFLHNQLLGLIGEYMAVGGMPEAVKQWLDNGDLNSCLKIHRLLIDTYRQDFVKYAAKKNQKYVEMVFNAIPRLSGKKFIFSAVSQEMRSRELRPALELLAKAGIAHIINHSSSNGLPLGSEINPQVSKVIFLDVALAQSVLGIDYSAWMLDPVSAIVNRGAVTESFVGQELLAYSPAAMKSELYYWVREIRGSMAEVDYVSGINGKVVPIEVKSGITGTLKSLHVFLEQKRNTEYGLQFSQRNYRVDKKVRRYPLYAIAAALRGGG